MKVLSKNDYKLLETLMRLNEKEVHEYMKQFLLQYYDSLIVNPAYIIAEGDIPIVLVAHMDTVDEGKLNYHMLYDRCQNIATSLYSLGFDDKAGIAAIAKVLESGLRPHIILSTQEESGCIGSSKLVADYPIPPFSQPIKYIIQIDRRGTTDCVFYDNNNTEFIEYIESFGYYKTALGSFTDISVLAPTWNVSAVNLSTGYFNEHTLNEYLYVPAWYETIRQVKIMLQAAEEAPYFDYVAIQYPLDWWKDIDYKYLDEYGIAYDKCDHCNKASDYNSLEEVVTNNNTIELWCDECIQNYADTCMNCYEIYELTSNPEQACPCCGVKRKTIKYDIHHRRNVKSSKSSN